MRNDDLSDAVGVDEAHKEDEWDEVMIQNDRLEVKIGRDENPCHKERYETSKCDSCPLTAGTASMEDIKSAGVLIVRKAVAHIGDKPMKIPLDCIEYQYHPTVYHVPFVPCQFIQDVGNEGKFRNADGTQ